MIRKLLPYLATALFIVAIAHNAQADDRVCWQHPVERVDGTPLAVSEIRGTVLRWKAGLDASTLDGSMEVVAPLTCQIIARDESQASDRCYSAATVDLTGAQSTFTAWVNGSRCRTVEPEPKARPRVTRSITVEKAPPP